MYKPIPSEYYGDNTRWFIATVIDASPPYGFEGRVKIRVHGLHTESTRDIPQDALPWAQCVLPTTEGGVSGLGRIPQLQPSALVFGMFMDGKNSQTPIVLGSLPHLELPTLLQSEQALEDIGDDSKPNGIWDNIKDFFAPKDVDVQNEESGNINNLTRLSRQKAIVRFFLNVGYTIKQGIAVAACLELASGLRTGINVQAQGIADFDDTRYTKLKEFSPNYNFFYTQLAFIVYELRGEYTSANIKLLQKDRLEGKNQLVEIFCKHYLKKSDATFIKQSELAARRIMEKIG